MIVLVRCAWWSSLFLRRWRIYCFLAIRDVEMMSKACFQEVLVGVSESTLSSSTSCIGELELQLASKNSDVDAAMAQLEGTERRLQIAEDAANLKQMQVQSQGPQVCEVEPARIGTKATWAAAESNIQLLTRS